MACNQGLPSVKNICGPQLNDRGFMVWVQLPHTHVCVECERLRTEHVSLQGIAVDQWSRIEASSHPMGNILSYISLSMVSFTS